MGNHNLVSYEIIIRSPPLMQAVAICKIKK